MSVHPNLHNVTLVYRTPSDIVIQNFETKFSNIKLPRYYSYHPWQCHYFSKICSVSVIITSNMDEKYRMDNKLYGWRWHLRLPFHLDLCSWISQFFLFPCEWVHCVCSSFVSARLLNKCGSSVVHSVCWRCSTATLVLYMFRLLLLLLLLCTYIHPNIHFTCKVGGCSLVVSLFPPFFFQIFNTMELLGMEKSMTSSLELVLHI